MLDVDGSGQLDLKEFCDGIVKLTTSDISAEMMAILKLLRLVREGG